ncbi:MAG: BatD family protein, partial [Bacteroidales bacterium]
IKTQSQQKSRDPFFDSFFNDPFFNRYKTVEIPLSTNNITIDVSPLPSQNKPADFSGAVGSFNLNSEIDKTELKANEAINLKFTINGSGNVELIDKINVVFPPDFEVYDPKVNKSINTSPSGVSGRKTFEYLIIPRTPGDFTIPPVKFSYFDLKKNRYTTLTSPEYNISVAKGDGTISDVTYSGVNQADIKYIGSDIRHIKMHVPKMNVIGNYFFGSGTFYLLLFLPLIIFILFTIIWSKELKKRSNIAIMKKKKATKVAQKRMKQASIFLKENKKDAFFIEVSQALWGYLSDKFSIPLATLSMDTVNDSLKAKEVKEETIEQFISTLNNCEFARFAPGDNAAAMGNIYNEAVEIISRIESELK